MNIDSEAYIRNVVREIVRECNILKIKTNPNIITYFVKLLLLDPNWGITSDSIVTRDNVQQFVKYVVKELNNEKMKPKILTLKMQFYYSCSLENLKLAVIQNRSQLRNRLKNLEKNIISTTSAQLMEDHREVDLLYKKMIFYITLLSGLGNPDIEPVYGEAFSAFKSILSEDELKEFTLSDNSVKEQLLEEYTKIVTGIRLFNKSCGKGGEGIEDLPDLLDKAIDALKEELQNGLTFVMDAVNLLTTLIDKCYIQTQTEHGYEMLYETPSKSRMFSIEHTKELLILYRQYELLMRQTMEEFSKLRYSAKNIFEDIESKLRKVHKAVYLRIAIPVEIVFPLFVELADAWTELQDQVIVLTRLNEILENLNKFAKDTGYQKEFYEHILGDDKSLTDVERLEATADCVLEIEGNDNATVVNLENFQLNIDTQLQYHGFCPWKLVETDGALIPGNSNMGIVRYQNMNFVFSTPEAGTAFSKVPDEYVKRVLSLARKRPQLINFFGLNEHLRNVMHIGKLVEKAEEVIECENKEVQTSCDHPEPDEESNSKYKWNIWDYKQEALTLASALAHSTHSTQTDKSYSKVSMGTQTYDQKQTAQQTMRDNYTNVARPSVYIYGLRGRKDDKQFKIHLVTPPTYE